MSQQSHSIIKQALELTASERADIAETLLSSLDHPDSELDVIWAKEADARVEAYERGELTAVPVNEVLGKYSK